MTNQPNEEFLVAFDAALQALIAAREDNAAPAPSATEPVELDQLRTLMARAAADRLGPLQR